MHKTVYVSHINKEWFDKETWYLNAFAKLYLLFGGVII